MNKTFTVEIEIAESWIQDGFEFSESRINEAFQRGIGELLPYAYESETKVKVVEQSVEPLKNQEKMLDLLTRASDSLNYYCTELNGDMNDSLAMEIDEYIRENTKGKTE